MRMIEVDSDECVVLTKENYKKLVSERDTALSYLGQLIEHEENLHKKMNGAFMFIVGHPFYKDDKGKANEAQ